MGSTHFQILGYDNQAKGVQDVRPKVFGELVKLATPHLKGFHSDLYHDAIWLQERMTGDAFTFYYTFNNSGTDIADSAEVLMRAYKYKFVVEYKDNKFMLTREDLTETSTLPTDKV